jgi:hypothetical protein
MLRLTLSVLPIMSILLWIHVAVLLWRQLLDMNCASYWPMSRTIHSLSHHGTVREDHTSAHLVSSHSPIYLVSPFFVYGNTPIYVFYVGRYIWFRLRVLVTRRDTFFLRLLSPSTPLLSCHSSPP